MLSELLRHLGEKDLEVIVCPGRDLLEIDGQSLKLVRLEKPHDVPDTGCPCRRISEKLREPRSVPLPLYRVLNHRQDRSVPFSGPDIFQRPFVDVGLQVHGRTLEIEPAGYEPIE